MFVSVSVKPLVVSSSALAMAALFAPVPIAEAYSGEDMLSGDPWHHEDITCRALVGDAACLGEAADSIYEGEFGFSDHAAHAIAWNADYLDSYMYSPLWWVSAGRSGQPVRNMRRRYIAAMANYWNFASLHFDDLNSSDAIEAAWQRHLAGALVGLTWAAEEDDIQSAYNILGLALHANQDFYSHSTWINSEARRKLTFLEAAPALIEASALVTGAYERDVAPVQHGKYSFACTVYNRDGVQTLMKPFCSDAFPTANFEFCNTFRDCENGEDTRVKLDVGPLPVTSVVLQPPGIAMDNTYVARVGADQRGLDDVPGLPETPPAVERRMRVPASVEARFRDAVALPEQARGGMLSRDQIDRIRDAAGDREPPLREAAEIDAREHCAHIVNRPGDWECSRESDYLFAESKHLAITSSRQWLRLVDAFMSHNHPDFWQRVKSCTPSDGRAACPGEFRYAFPPGSVKAPFEDYGRFPFQFITAGHDAPLARTSPDDWFLRIELVTADERGAGTSADVRALTPGGGDHLLDYLAMANPHSEVRGILTYDDLERGDTQVYTIGPLDRLPDRLTLFNDSSTRKEVRKAFGRAFKRRLENGFHALRRTFRNTEDYVGEEVREADTATLDDIIANGTRTIARDGGSGASAPGIVPVHIYDSDEGHYRFNFAIAKTAWSDAVRYPGWSEYRIELRDIDVLAESTVDGGSSDDEPFFFVGLSSYGVAEPEFLRLGPYKNIGTNGNDRDHIAVGHVFDPVRLPRGGVVAMALQGWESDNERARDRDELWDGFRNVLTEAEREAYPEFISEWGRNLGGDWKLAEMRVWGFQRGRDPKYGLMLDRTGGNALDRWIEEDERADFALDTAQVRSLGATLDRVNYKTRVLPAQLAHPGIVMEPVVVLAPDSPESDKAEETDVEPPEIKIDPNRLPKRPVPRFPPKR